MVIAPAHGYLSFDCPSVGAKGAYGFYPLAIGPNDYDSLLKFNNLQGLGTSAVHADQASGFTAGRIASLQATQKFSVIISPLCSLGSIGTTRTAFECAIQNGPPKGAFNVAISAIASGGIVLEKNFSIKLRTNLYLQE